MKKIYGSLILLLFMSLFMSSCSKFLEEYSTDQKYATTTQDLNNLMIGEAFMNSANPSINNQATMLYLTSDNDITMPWYM